jgi:homoserine O-succinyltransferase
VSQARQSCDSAALRGGQGRRSLVVGLLNNMSDGALVATEEQFCGLLREAAPPELDLTFRYFSLHEVERGGDALRHMLGRYEHIGELLGGGLDALVVTGAEPRTQTLEQEPYWPSLARVIDWSEAAQIPAVWSCLAAHAAALRLSGVSRKRLPAKHSGVFALQVVGEHPLLEGAPSRIVTPHSRWNDLSAREIEDAGYEILACSPDVGVDTFVGPGPAFGIYFQGHPEYDAGALAREYLRDVSRFLRGQHAHHPSAPAGYFDPGTLDVLQNLSRRVVRPPDPRLLEEYAVAIRGRPPQAPWRPWALHIYRGWLRQVSGLNVRNPRPTAAHL